MLLTSMAHPSAKIISPHSLLKFTPLARSLPAKNQQPQWAVIIEAAITLFWSSQPVLTKHGTQLQLAASRLYSMFSDIRTRTITGNKPAREDLREVVVVLLAVLVDMPGQETQSLKIEVCESSVVACQQLRSSSLVKMELVFEVHTPWVEPSQLHASPWAQIQVPTAVACEMDHAVSAYC